MNDLTPTQKQVYYIIKDFINQKGYSPSFRELASLNGNNSVGTIAVHIRKLKEKGYIDYTDKLSRTMIILK